MALEAGRVGVGLHHSVLRGSPFEGFEAPAARLAKSSVMTEQFSSMERDAFHIAYLSDKIPKSVFHGQALKTVAYLRVSTAQQDVRSQHARQQTNRGEAGGVDLGEMECRGRYARNLRPRRIHQRNSPCN